MKKYFEKPAIVISEFSVENVITDSAAGTTTLNMGSITVTAKDVLDGTYTIQE